jgi:uncharacterized protein YgbK (DUF1537 family)
MICIKPKPDTANRPHSIGFDSHRPAWVGGIWPAAWRREGREPVFRLLADDLSGALDSAAPFAATRGPLPVLWSPGESEGDAAFDSETRHCDEAVAAARAGALASRLAGAEIAFMKIDSVLRGHPAAEIAAVQARCQFRTVVIAPAFPAQGRITRSGRQLVCGPQGDRTDTGVDLAADLAARGIEVRRGGMAPGGGVFLCDAATDEDLVALVASRPRLLPPVLWCGSGGLAHALAGRGSSTPAQLGLPPPVLLVVGTAHPVTAGQLQRMPPPGPYLHTRRLDLPPGSPRASARAGLASLVADVARQPAPGSVLVTGGETLMALCLAMGASALQVSGELVPGVALSRFVGGRWAGVRVASKSGGFGDPGLLQRLLSHTADGLIHA